MAASRQESGGTNALAAPSTSHAIQVPLVAARDDVVERHPLEHPPVFADPLDQRVAAGPFACFGSRSSRCAPRSTNANTPGSTAAIARCVAWKESTFMPVVCHAFAVRSD